MQFLYPYFLWSLVFLAIPVVIHLFFFRRFKKVYFTNVRFLKEVKEETSARRKLRNLLVLLSRMLALAFLVFAFAQPFLPVKEQTRTGSQAVSVFVDNSFSMEALSKDVPLLEKAKQRAREIIQAHSVEDRFQVLTHDFEGRHQQLLGKEDALALVDEIERTPAVRDLSQVLARQKQALQSGKSENLVAYLISDFQRNITRPEELNDSTLSVNLVPLQAVRERNISIDSCWFVAPVQMINQTNTLVVQVTNHSNEDVDNIRLALNHEGQTKPVGTLTIPGGQTVSDTVNITLLNTGWHEARISITDFPITFDDTYYFTFFVAEKVNVLSINDQQENRYLNAAFSGLPYFELTNLNVRNLSYSDFANYDLIILNDLIEITSGLGSELGQYIRNGGNVLLFPALEADINSYKSFLSGLQANELVNLERTERSVSSVNTQEFVFFDVFEEEQRNLKLPVTTANFKLTGYTQRGEESLLTYRDGNTFLGKFSLEKGHLYLCAAPLNTEVNDLVKNAEIFVPMLYKMAISSGSEKEIAYFIGKNEVLEVENRSSQGELIYKLKGGKQEFIPEKRNLANKVFLGFAGRIREAGYYDLLAGENEPLEKYAFNYDRRESDLDYYTKSELSEAVGGQVQVIDGDLNTDLTSLIAVQSKGVQLWRWCLILALAFLAVEVLLLRFWNV
jgi:hypothetical protein